MKLKLVAVFVGAVVSLAGCGSGGGSSTGNTVTPPVAQAPTVMVSLSKDKATAGSAVTVNWSSTNATSCTGSDGLSGVLATSGNQNITAGTGGQYKYSVSCTGAGGTSANTGTLVVPLPVLPSSYENKTANLFASTNLPDVYDPSMVTVLQNLSSSENGFNPRSISIADFFQEGAPSLFVATTSYMNSYPGNNPAKWADSPGRVHFLRKGSNGNWTDDTSRLIPDVTQRAACITSSYSIVADFNNDGRPDVYISCTGIDFQLNGVWTNDQDAQQLVFLSQPDGTYKRNVVSAGLIYGHEATAADIDGDGNIDIVTVDPHTNRTPFVLWGKGDGTFTPDMTRFPAETQDKEIFGAMLLTIDGVQKLILSGSNSRAEPAGSEWCNLHCFGTKVYRYSAGRFVLEKDLTPLIPKGSNGFAFGLALDHIYWNGSLYSFHVNVDYTEDVVVRYDLSNGTAQTVYSKVTASYGDALNLINITKDGYLENFGAACNSNDPLTANGICKLKKKL